MAYGDFKDFSRRTATVKVLRDKEFNIAKNSKYYGCQQSVASLFLIFLIERLLLNVQGRRYLLREINLLVTQEQELV